jgi:hypothetical protein
MLSSAPHQRRRKRRLMRPVTIAVLVLFSICCEAIAQQKPVPPPKPCTQPEASQFDFWLGDWNLEWGNGAHGRNVIKKTLDGCVIQESFDGGTSSPLRGMSVSTYNPRLGRWQQTWVDNQGGYLDFVGGSDGARMILQRKATINGQEFLQRMVWYDITPDALMWNWERSSDDGKTWSVQWQIKYTRNKVGRLNQTSNQ